MTSVSAATLDIFSDDEVINNIMLFTGVGHVFDTEAFTDIRLSPS